MKKLTTILLCLALAVALTACTTSDAQTPAAESVPATQTPITETAPTDTQAPAAKSAPAAPQTPAESAPTAAPQSAQSDPAPSSQTEETISRDRAIELALSEAGLTMDNVRDLEAELDRERGDLVWEVDFESGEFEYSYDINATTEEVVKVERDRD